MTLASFQFFVPAFLWALPVAAGLPVAAHLWTKFRAKPVAFASLMFFPSEVAPAAQVSRLDHRLLLALRVLALTSFALAFARPAWLGPAQVLPEGGRRVAIVLDRTASMNQVEGLGTAFDVAKFEADALLAKLDAHDQVMVVCADRACAPAWAGWLSAAQARARLGKLAPSWEAGDVGRAIEVAQEMGATEVVVWTDGQGEGQCHPRSADALVRTAPEVRVVGEAKGNGWLRKERPEEGMGDKPMVDVFGDSEASDALALALGIKMSADQQARRTFEVRRSKPGIILANLEPDISVDEMKMGDWNFSNGGRWDYLQAGNDDSSLNHGYEPGFESPYKGPRTIATADWSAHELAIFQGVSRAALIGLSLSDGVVLKPQSGDRILLRFSDGSPALMVLREGRTYILAGSPTGGPHPFANSPAFVPLVHELVKALLPPPPLPAHPGDALNLPVPVGGRILSPSGAVALARFGEPGVYRAVDAKGETTDTRWCEVEASEVEWSASSPDHREAVAVPGQGWNPWKKTTPDSTTLKGWRTSDVPPPFQGGDSLAQDSRGFTPGQEQASLRDAIELWPLFAILALLALLVEPLLIWHAGRKAQV